MFKKLNKIMMEESVCLIFCDQLELYFVASGDDTLFIIVFI